MNIPASFTAGQREYLMRCFASWFNVAEGGKRGGKNVLQTMAFCIALDEHPNRLHLVAGVTTATAGLNILDCDGYGLYNYFEGRCRKGQWQNRDCLYLKCRTGEKIVLVSGGGKNGDEKLIKGNTYGMAYVTEANECAQPFIQEVFDRTVSSRDRKVFHDLNPKSAAHWYYSEILEFHERQQCESAAYGYNYGHFTIADNMSIDDAQLKQVIGTYDKSSIWYQRDILGLRKQAEGLVYPMFREESHVVEAVPERGEYYISVDYGTVNPFSAGLWCKQRDTATRVAEYYFDSKKGRSQKTDEEYYAELVKLAGDAPVRAVIVDPSAASFIQCIRRHGRFSVRKADNSVLDGIRNTAAALNAGRINIHASCADCIREFGIYSWDTDKPEDTVIKENDHAMDDLRYFVQTILRDRGGRFIDARR